MTITLIALVLYFAIVLAFAIFSASAIYHIWQFGYIGDLSKPVAVIYLIISAGLIIITLFLVVAQLLRG